MGKASKWFRGLLGLKSSGSSRSRAEKLPTKKKWSLAKDKDRSKTQQGAGEDDNEASKHAIAVAAATAAVAEAAVAAAQAAAAVVHLTSSGRNISMPDVASAACGGAGYRSRKEWAAVTIQSHFRAYLSRRALRALKALVKLQALVRGHLVRKQTAYALRRLQALVRAQVRVRAGRVHLSESPLSSVKSSHFNYTGPATPEKFEHAIRARSEKHDQLMMLKRNGSKSRSNGRMWEHGHFARALLTEDERSDKILEVDTGNPHVTSKHRTLFYSSHLSLNSDNNCQSYSTSKDSTTRQSAPSPSLGEVQSLSPLKFTQDEDEIAFCTADNSPTYYSVSSRGGSSKRGTFTPTKSDGSRSCLSGYSDHPSYMAYTESSKAKVRSLSAPKQRPNHFERSSSTKRYSVHAYGDSRSTQFSSKAYPGSGRLDRLGMPVRGDVTGLSGGNWQRY